MRPRRLWRAVHSSSISPIPMCFVDVEASLTGVTPRRSRIPFLRSFTGKAVTQKPHRCTNKGGSGAGLEQIGLAAWLNAPAYWRYRAQQQKGRREAGLFLI